MMELYLVVCFLCYFLKILCVTSYINYLMRLLCMIIVASCNGAPVLTSVVHDDMILFFFVPVCRVS